MISLNLWTSLALSMVLTSVGVSLFASVWKPRCPSYRRVGNRLLPIQCRHRKHHFGWHEAKGQRWL